MRPLFLVGHVYLGAKGMCETMFLHFVPVDGVGLGLSTKLLAGKVCFYVENEPVDTLSMTLYEEHA